jgi:hypothetical protein
VATEVAKQTAAIEARVQQRIEAAVAPLRLELRELRQRLAETENTMRDFTNAIGDTVRMAAERTALAAEWRREAAPEAVEVPRRPAASVQHQVEHRAPRHVDLRTVRQRLAAAGRPDEFPRSGFPQFPQTAPATRRQPLVVPFRVAS